MHPRADEHKPHPQGTSGSSGTTAKTAAGTSTASEGTAGTRAANSSTAGQGGRPKNLARRRTSLLYQARYAVRHPRRVAPYARRLARDTWLRIQSRGDHVRYYRLVMRSDTSRSPEAAVGSQSHERWLALGKMQFDYLVGHGLSPGDRLLEIGCGNLRAGWRFIAYLEAGNFYGLDISPDILLQAQKTIVRYELADKVPYLVPVDNLRFEHLPDEHFDVVHAHSVFSHSPIEVIDECLAHVGRVMKKNGWFDFTFDRTTGDEHQVLREDFYYRTETLVALAGRHGLDARLMDDWERLPHGQSKIRVTRKDGTPRA